MSDEWTRYYHEPEWFDLEVLHARFVDHTYARHAHDYFVVGYVEAGVQAYRYRGSRHTTTAGHIFLVNPDEVHTGEAATSAGYIYRTLYPRPELMARVTADIRGRRSMPLFKEAVLHDPELARLLVSFHRALAKSASRLAIESLLLEALIRLIVHHADESFSERPVGRERKAVRQAREFLDVSFHSNITLSRLAGVVGLSPFHLARAFVHDVGAPPHVYLEMVRTRRARCLLERGASIADVALEVGYADQSHLTHRFKRHFGITPGQYARERKLASQRVVW
jgi:AraC-like DNA-binding protein